MIKFIKEEWWSLLCLLFLFGTTFCSGFALGRTLEIRRIKKMIKELKLEIRQEIKDKDVAVVFLYNAEGKMKFEIINGTVAVRSLK